MTAIVDIRSLQVLPARLLRLVHFVFILQPGGQLRTAARTAAAQQLLVNGVVCTLFRITVLQYHYT